MRETGESSRFWQLTPSFTQHFTPSNFWEVEVLLQSKERTNHTTTIDVSA